MIQTKNWVIAAILIICGASMLTACDNEDNSVVPTPDEPVVLNCAKPDYLQTGDKVALISPSYFTPMENVEKTAVMALSSVSSPTVARSLPMRASRP